MKRKSLLADRHARMLVKDPLHIDPWGVAITTPDVRPDSATINIDALLKNDSDVSGDVVLSTVIMGPGDKMVVSDRVPVDLVFLDLDFAGTNYREWYGSLSSQPLLICLANASHKVIDAFNIDAVDCLVKPFGQARFRQAIEKTTRAMRIRRFMNESARPYIFVRSQYQLVKIMFEDIQYIAAKVDFVRIYRYGKPPVDAYITMRHLADNLPPRQFVRIHRKFIVPVDKICHYDYKQVFLGEMPFPIGLTFRNALAQSIRKTTTL
jgi:DNA-binding LytR/AlgR family response regulator